MHTTAPITLVIILSLSGCVINTGDATNRYAATVNDYIAVESYISLGMSPADVSRAIEPTQRQDPSPAISPQTSTYLLTILPVSPGSADSNPSILSMGCSPVPCCLYSSPD